MGRETQETQYAGQWVYAGRWQFAVRNGKLITRDTLGKMPIFDRKSQPGSIVIQSEDGPGNLDIGLQPCLS